MTKINVSKAKSNPTAVFDAPADVLKAPLPKPTKLEILESWEQDAVQLQKATEENMTGGEPSRIDEVRKAIDIIEAAKTPKDD